MTHTFLADGRQIIELTSIGVIDRLMSFDEYLEDGRVKQLREEMYPKAALARV